MFKKVDLSPVWKVVNFHNWGYVSDGKPLNLDLQEITIPSLEEIAEEEISKLKREGYSVYRVSPKRANCILRVFRHEGLPYEDNMFWLYGADVFLKTPKRTCSSYDALIDYSSYRVELRFDQKDFVILKPNFVDYFLKVKVKTY